MANLRRVRQGIFTIDNSKKVSDITEEDFISITDSLSDMPRIVVNDPILLKKINNGMKLDRTIDKMTCFLERDNNLIAIYYPDGEIMRALKVFPKNIL